MAGNKRPPFSFMSKDMAKFYEETPKHVFAEAFAHAMAARSGEYETTIEDSELLLKLMREEIGTLEANQCFA